VQSAFTHGMDMMLATTAGICALAAVLAVIVLPRSRPAGSPLEEDAAVEGPVNVP
jgi:hypothetical protein